MTGLRTRVSVMLGAWIMVTCGMQVYAMPPPVEVGSDIPAPQLDLVEAWLLAVDHDPALKRASASRDASFETRIQARSQLLPQVGFQAYREDSSSDGERLGLTGAGIGMVSSRTNTDTSFAGLQLRQPIIAIDRWVALQQANDLRDAAELQYQFDRENLMLRLVQAYFGVLAAQDGFAVAESHLAAVRRFREQIGHRYDAGVVANTDLQEAQAALDTANADAIDARHRVMLARQSLSDLTGVRGATLRGLSEGLVPAAPEPAGPDWWMQRAEQDATPVRLAQIGHGISRREIERRRAASYPTLDFVASRSRLDQSSSNPFENIDIEGNTVRLELNVPLFAGGAIQSRVRQAAAEHREAGYRLDEVRLQTSSQAHRAWLGINAAVERVRAREQALRSATAARQAAELGVIEGVRTTLDVLDSQRQYASARAALSMARYEYVLGVFALRAATGLLEEETMVQVNAWLD